MEKKYILLPDRAILKISGDDRHNFLQGLITQDIRLLTPYQTIYSAFLTSQGRFLYDFFLTELNDAIYLDIEVDRRDDLVRCLKLYKLRSQVMLSDETQLWNVISLFGDQVHSTFGIEAELGKTLSYKSGNIYVDPRLKELGLRALLPQDFDKKYLEEKNFRRAEITDYEDLRLSLGVPDGSRDMKVNKAIPLECNLDELNAIGWEKGCYMGQELTARTKYVGIVRKRLIPVLIERTNNEEAEEIIFCEGLKIGTLQSRCGNRGLALLRLEDLKKVLLENKKLQWGENFLIPFIPDWMKCRFDTIMNV